MAAKRAQKVYVVSRASAAEAAKKHPPVASRLGREHLGYDRGYAEGTGVVGAVLSKLLDLPARTSLDSALAEVAALKRQIAQHGNEMTRLKAKAASDRISDLSLIARLNGLKPVFDDAKELASALKINTESVYEDGLANRSPPAKVKPTPVKPSSVRGVAFSFESDEPLDAEASKTIGELMAAVLTGKPT